MISPDPRLRAYAALLVPAFVGHTIQLLGEDLPWQPHAWSRYWTQPGWHLFVPWWAVVAIAVGLAVAVVGIAIRRTRPWLVALVPLYVAHYLTYPFRIRNHMSHMFFGMVMLGGVWLAGRRRNPEEVDRAAVRGLALVLCITYFFAGFHKINDAFLSIGPDSSAASAITDFVRYAGLGSEAPAWAKWCAAYGAVGIECVVPIVAWRSTRLRVPALLTLMLFHFPMVSAMNVADYPMIVAASYPCLFSRTDFERLLQHLGPSRWTLTGAAVGVLMQLWAMPWWGALTIFGLFVMGLFGWSAGAMIDARRAR